MSKRIHSAEQIAQLQANPHVLRCSERYIWYDPAFKVRAVQRHKEGYGSGEIFEEAGFDLAAIGRKKVKECLSRWRRTERERGEVGLREKLRRRGRPKKQWKTEEERIAWLETENAYLKAENAFLAQLRANKRAE